MRNTWNKKQLTLRTAIAAFALTTLFACGGGGGGGGDGEGQDRLGTIESGTGTAAPRTGGQATTPTTGGATTTPADGTTKPTDGAVTTTTPTDGASTTTTQPDATPAAVAVGFQAVLDTPVATVPPHPGHEPLATQVPPSPAPPATPAFTREWFVSPSGNDNNSGAAGQPFKTLAKGIQSVGPGEVLRVQGGDYNEAMILAGKDGSPAAKITIQGEGQPRITGGGNVAVQFKAKHWVVDGFKIDMQNQAKFAVSFEGNDEGSTLANSEVMNGTAGAGINVHTNSNGAIIENNNIHHFSRGDTDSHGIVVQTTTRNTTIRNNDIHDVSGDTAQCLGPEGYNNNPPADGLLIENNHLYGAQENALDIKTCHNVTIRNNRMHTFRAAPAGQGAKGDAIVIHLSAKNVIVEGNEIYDAGKGIALGGNRIGGPMPAGVVIRRNTIHDLIKDSLMEGTAMRIENSDGAVVVNNVFWNLQGPGVILGHGTNGPTQNLTLKNNIIGGTGLSLKVGSQAPGLKADGNLYPVGAQFSVNGAARSFDQWKASGQDVSSVTADPAFSPGGFKPGAAAVDKGQNVGLSFCGTAPDIGAVETAC